MTIMIYGATGYTGRAILKRMILEKIPRAHFVCCGRDAAALSRLAERLVDEDREIRAVFDEAPTLSFPLQWRIAEVDDRRSLDKALRDIRVLINAAGPFRHTALPLARACAVADRKPAYLDTSGDLDDLLLLADELANGVSTLKGIPALCGTGFTPVIATEMARVMQRAFKKAGFAHIRQARVGMAMPTRSSRGSARTALDAAARTRVYRGGVLREVPSGSLERSFPVHGEDARQAICGVLTLADLHQIGVGLGIPNVECYFEMHALTRTVMAGVGLAHAIDRWLPWKNFAQRSMALLPDAFDMRVDVHRKDPPKLVCVELEDELQRCATMVVAGGDHYDSTAALVVSLGRDLIDLGPGFSWQELVNTRAAGWTALNRDGPLTINGTSYDKEHLNHLPRTRKYLAELPCRVLKASDSRLRTELASAVKHCGLFPLSR
jgi:short subunit dehydrogenase-like uncharacterized protein